MICIRRYSIHSNGSSERRSSGTYTFFSQRICCCSLCLLQFVQDQLFHAISSYTSPLFWSAFGKDSLSYWSSWSSWFRVHVHVSSFFSWLTLILLCLYFLLLALDSIFRFILPILHLPSFLHIILVLLDRIFSSFQEAWSCFTWL